jgi:hypothetical protein
MRLLSQLAAMRTALFRFQVSKEFHARFRLFKSKPPHFDLTSAPTKDFWSHVLVTKIEATIGNISDVISWEDDHKVTGPVAYAAK